MAQHGTVPTVAPVIDGVAGHLLPWRELATVTGRRLDLRWSRTAWAVLVTHGGGCPSCPRLVDDLAAMAPDLQAWKARVVVLVPPAAAKEPTGAGATDMVDLVVDGGDLRAAAGLDPDRIGLLVADRFGVVWNADVHTHHRLPDTAELVARVRFLAIQCPECETLDAPVDPAWTTR